MYAVCPNPSMIHLTEKYYKIIHPVHHVHIDFTFLACNPLIFEYDYDAMRLRMKPVAEELIANRFHPRNFEKWIGWGFDEHICD
jgi:hypothetical protein